VIEISAPARVLTYLFMFTMLLSIGLELTGRQVVRALADVPLMGRALVANLICVPLLGLVLVWLFPMPADAAAGVLILAAAPGAPFAVQFTSKAKDAVAFAAALLLVLTLIALFLTPHLAGVLLRADLPLALPVGRAAKAVLLYLLAPLVLGFALQRWVPGVAAALLRPATWCAALSFPAVIVLTMAMKSAATRTLGAPALIALLLLVLGGMLIGWLLGGPDTGTRRVLATSTGMRNVAIALLVALTSFPDSDVDVAVLAFSALMVPPNLVFTIYQNRRARRRSA
jgi:BASS family bile acid:Na+ symporter